MRAGRSDADRPGAEAKTGSAGGKSAASTWFAGMMGAFFFLVIIKFGDPVVIEATNVPPKSWEEILYGAWPPAWGRWILLGVGLASLGLIRWRKARFQWILALPAVWLLWQFVAASQTIDATLTRFTLPHLVACAALFYLGYFGLNGVRWPWPVVAGMGLAFCWTMRSAVEQHFGGLAATQHYYIYSVYGAKWPEIAAKYPDFAKRIATGRVFASFVSPNALAGAIWLFLPMTLVFVWQITPKVSRAVRMVFVGILGACGLAILYWSGSKAGWLLAVVMVMMILAQSPLALKWRVGLAVAFVALALGGFAARYSRYFERGATSAAARFDYWRAAGKIIEAHPVVGTGPGTFGRSYEALKDPKSEMAWLCHDDYLEQGTDSGLVGMGAYVLFIFWSVYAVYRYRFVNNWGKEPLIAAVSLGVVVLCLHSFVEYHLYLPALAWPLFFILGWLWSINDKVSIIRA